MRDIVSPSNKESNHYFPLINVDPFYHKEVCSELAPKTVDLFLSLEERTDLGIGEAVGAPLSDHPVSIVFL